MAMQLNPIGGIRIAGMATAWPEDLLGPTARKCDDDVYADILGDNWRNELADRQWDFNRARDEFGVEQRSWTRGTDVDSIALAIAAGERALADAGIAAGDLDCIVAATCTPTHVTSTVAAKIARQLGTNAATIDIRAGGAGGLNALSTAANYHASGCKTSLVVAAETSSKYLNDRDLSNALLFGDGAAALVLISDPQAGEAGLAGTVIGNCNWGGNPFTVPGILPPTGQQDADAFRFQRPDAEYRDCLAAGWDEASRALRDAFPSARPDAVLPYAVTRQQVNKCATEFGISADASLRLLAGHGCIGCASPLAAMVEHWQQADHAHDAVASLAVAGGISWAGLLWRR